jgi:hypothetical protein
VYCAAETVYSCVAHTRARRMAENRLWKDERRAVPIDGPSTFFRKFDGWTPTMYAPAPRRRVQR